VESPDLRQGVGPPSRNRATTICTDGGLLVNQNIALVTDSTCDLDSSTISRHGIHVLPLHIVYAKQTYRDRVDITPEEIYARFGEEVPTTSTPSPQEAADLLTQVRDSGFTHALAVHISSGLSATADTVRMAAEQVKGLETFVVNSKTLSMGLGFIVEQAAHWVEEKLDFRALIERTQEMVTRSRAFYVVRTLEYLRRGGRIGAVAAAVAGALDLKPIISIDKEGRYYSHSRVRGRRQSLVELFKLVGEAVENGLDQVAIMHGDAKEEASELHERVKTLPGVKRTVFGQISPVLVVHTGPGLVGAAMTRA